MLKPNSGVQEIIDEKYSFKSYFKPENGYYLRTGIIDKDGNDTGCDPFMSSFPQLLDVGIMGHCLHGLSGRCALVGNKCYQSGKSKNEPNMTFENYKKIVDESKGKVFQFALGGRGDPDQHEDFEKILAYTRENGIIPNMTTSGFMLNEAKAKLIAKYCGAVAVSWYKSDYTHKSIDMLREAGIKVNIHFVLSKNSIDEAIDFIENKKFENKINRVIFLLYKPVGEGNNSDVLPLDNKTKYFFSLLGSDYGIHKAGFDSCSVPGIVNYATRLDPASYDACEAGRFSAYVTSDMKMLPCSFDQDLRYAVPLENNTIQKAWESEQFEEFRNILRNACKECSKRENCLGGCPIKNEITLCERSEKQ